MKYQRARLELHGVHVVLVHNCLVRNDRLAQSTTVPGPVFRCAYRTLLSLPAPWRPRGKQQSQQQLQQQSEFDSKCKCSSCPTLQRCEFPLSSLWVHTPCLTRVGLLLLSPTLHTRSLGSNSPRSFLPRHQFRSLVRSNSASIAPTNTTTNNNARGYGRHQRTASAQVGFLSSYVSHSWFLLPP